MIKTLSVISLFNLLGLAGCFLYGIYGGPGGKTTEGVFLGIEVVGLVTVLASGFLMAFQLKKLRKLIFWSLALIVLGVMEVLVVFSGHF